MNNIKLLKYSINHPEPLLDNNYMFVEMHEDLEKYSQQTREIKNTLIALKEIKKQTNKEAKRVAYSLYKRLPALLKKYAQFSEFGCFINACDTTVEIASKNLDALRKITDIYLIKRHLNEIVPSEWIQALIDKTSSRKKGQAGEKKLLNILKSKGYFYSEKFTTFMASKRSVSKFKGDFSLKGIMKNFKVSIGKDSQNKKMDLCIKNGSAIYFLEAKHISISGGAQNKQIKELIDIIKNKIPKSSYHQVSFLDGVYFNLLFSKSSSLKKAFVKEINSTEEEEENSAKILNKLESQKANILQALEDNEGNYFINSAGFKRLF